MKHFIEFVLISKNNTFVKFKNKNKTPTEKQDHKRVSMCILLEIHYTNFLWCLIQTIQRFLYNLIRIINLIPCTRISNSLLDGRTEKQSTTTNKIEIRSKTFVELAYNFYGDQ